MIASIAGAVLGAAGSIVGGITSAHAKKKVRKQYRKRKKENEDWYNRRYNESATQRADAQALLTNTERIIRDRNRAAAGRQAVVGGTDEAVAATRADNSEAIANTAAQIVAANEQRKDSIEQQYLSRRDELDDKLAGLEAQRSQNISTATSNLLNTAGSIAASLDTNKKGSTETSSGQQGAPQDFGAGAGGTATGASAGQNVVTAETTGTTATTLQDEEVNQPNA